MQGGGITFFHSFSQTGKVVEEILEFKHLYLLTLQLNWENISTPGALISELADYLIFFLSVMQ